MYKDRKESNFNFLQKFNSIEDLEDKINKYFDYCDIKEKPYTISGLALYLDTTRQTLLEWETRNYSSLTTLDNTRLSYTIRKAKLRVENFVEEQLFTNKTVSGVIFNLKNNFGYVDKQEIVASTNTAPDLSNLSEKDLQKLLEMPETQLIE